MGCSNSFLAKTAVVSAADSSPPPPPANPYHHATTRSNNPDPNPITNPNTNTNPNKTSNLQPPGPSPRHKYALSVGELVLYLYQLSKSSGMKSWIETEVASIDHKANGDADVTLLMKKSKDSQASIRFESNLTSNTQLPPRTSVVVSLDKNWKHIAPMKALKLGQLQIVNGKVLSDEQEAAVQKYITASSENVPQNTLNISSGNSNSGGGSVSNVNTSVKSVEPEVVSGPRKTHSRRKSMNNDMLTAIQSNMNNNNSNNNNNSVISTGSGIDSDSPDFKLKSKQSHCGKLDLSQGHKSISNNLQPNIASGTRKIAALQSPALGRGAKEFVMGAYDVDKKPAPMLKSVGRHRSLELPQVQSQYRTEQVFSDRMEQAGMYIVEVEADGNCLFRATAHQFYMDESRHAEVRRSCVKHMLMYRDRFSKFCTTNFDEHVKRMSQDGTWGDDLEIKALEEIFDREFYIYAPDSTKHLVPVPMNVNFDEPLLKPRLALEQENSAENSTSDVAALPVKISYHGSCHYNSVFDQYHPLPLSVCETRIILNTRLKRGF